jgi:hypothetical protein
MSQAVTVLTPLSKSDWTAAELAGFIQSAGFALTLEDFDPKTQVGFLPGDYRGLPAGFEYFCDTVDEYLETIEDDGQELTADEVARIRRFGYVVQMVTHARYRDGAAACVAAGCLAAMTGGHLLDNASGEWIPADRAIVWSRNQEQEYLPHLAEDDE